MIFYFSYHSVGKFKIFYFPPSPSPLSLYIWYIYHSIGIYLSQLFLFLSSFFYSFFYSLKFFLKKNYYFLFSTLKIFITLYFTSPHAWVFFYLFVNEIDNMSSIHLVKFDLLLFFFNFLIHTFLICIFLIFI